MKRIFPGFAYGPEPRAGCWWDQTIPTPDWSSLNDDIAVDVAIVGGGFTGMSAALHLAEAGASVAVLEANTPGWGASGRNGGFCCLGGSALDEPVMARAYGAEQTAEFRQAEQDAVDLAESLITRLGMKVDRHSQGETLLAHSAKAMAHLRREAVKDPSKTLIEAGDLACHGMNGPFHGALTTPSGFGLNPRKYLFGLSAGAQVAGAMCFQHSAVCAIDGEHGHFVLRTPKGRVSCKNVIIATNGYSSDDIPGWMSARYLPTQSAILVTRPLSRAEVDAQGWSSDQMGYDSRNLLHYFRLMPDRRFLFGMRGGLLSSAWSERRVNARVRRDFETMFPAWKSVESPFQWSGLVCISRNLVPFVGAVPEHPGMFAGLAYHGNGVAMGGYCGRLLADLVLGRDSRLAFPSFMRRPPARFPLGRFRRLLMPPIYALKALGDL